MWWMSCAYEVVRCEPFLSRFEALSSDFWPGIAGCICYMFVDQIFQSYQADRISVLQENVGLAALSFGFLAFGNACTSESEAV